MPDVPDERTQALLAAYVDGDLPPDRAAEVERLLRDSPRQRRVVEEMRQARGWLSTLPRVSAPAAVRQAIRDAMDPELERAALLGGADEGPMTRLWPRVLGLAAVLVVALTLAVALYALRPAGPAGDLAINVEPTNQIQTPPQLVETTRPVVPAPVVAEAPTPEVAEVSPPTPAVADASEGSAPESENTEPPVVEASIPEPPAVADAGSPDVVEDLPGIPEIPEGAVIVSARVDDLPAASGVVAGYLAAQSLPIVGGRVDASRLDDLDEALARRDEPSRAASGAAMFVVPEARLAQAGDLTGALSAAGAHAPTVTAAPRRAKGRLGDAEMTQADAQVDMVGVPRPAPPSQARRVFADDVLTLVLSRSPATPGADVAPPADVPPGVPEPGQSGDLRVVVGGDGLADLSALGLGRVDVLGREVADLAQEVRGRLSDDKFISANVSVLLSERSRPPEGRTETTLEAMRLDRRAIGAGDLLRLDRPDGTWVQAVVGADGFASLPEMGRVEVWGRSPAEVQAELRDRVAADVIEPPAPAATTEPSTAPATQPEAVVITASPQPIRLTNLSTRRRAGNDPSADEVVPVVVVLLGGESAEDVQPATAPAVDP